MTEPIVVGVSPSTGSPNALRWAADEAKLRGVPLRAVLAWRPPYAAAAPGGRPPARTSVGTESRAAERMLRRHVAAALGETVIDCVTVRGQPVPVLLRASADAQLLVIGEPRAGRLASVRTGLVARQLVQRAACPVVVLPSSGQARV